MNTLQQIADLIKHLKSATLFTHIRPDGDTIGGALALSRALTLLGIKNEVVNESPVNEKYFFLNGEETVKLAPTFEAEGFICIDSSDITRLGTLQSLFKDSRKTTINVDHHISNTRYCKYNFVRERSSNCENVAELIELLGVKEDRLIASYLFMGMVTDSGGFSHADVNGDTFRAAAVCADAGAEVDKITYEIFKKRTKNRAEFYLYVLSKLRFELEGKLAIAIAREEDLVRYDVSQDATEGIVDFGLTVDTVEVSVCLLEVKKGQYKVSLRSKGKVNVNEMARVYGGGGHILAAGCMLFGEIEEIVDKLCYGTRQQLDL